MFKQIKRKNLLKQFLPDQTDTKNNSYETIFFESKYFIYLKIYKKYYYFPYEDVADHWILLLHIL